MSSKLPVTLEQAKEFFTQKRKAGLVNVVTEMLVKDAAPEVTKDKMEPAKRAKVLSEIDRAPTLKFSKKAREAVDNINFEVEAAQGRVKVDGLLNHYNLKSTLLIKKEEKYYTIPIRQVSFFINKNKAMKELEEFIKKF